MIPNKTGELLFWNIAKPNPVDDAFIKDKRNRNDYFEKVSLSAIEVGKTDKIVIGLFAPHPLLSLVKQKLRRIDNNRKIERMIVAISSSGDLFILTDSIPATQIAHQNPQSQFISFGANLHSPQHRADQSVDISGLHNESGILDSDEEELV
jgi:hypothetical protein